MADKEDCTTELLARYSELTRNGSIDLPGGGQDESGCLDLQNCIHESWKTELIFEASNATILNDIVLDVGMRAVPDGYTTLQFTVFTAVSY